MTIITKGMGAIIKAAKKRKTLTISVPKSKPKLPTMPTKREVIIKKKLKPSKTKLADTWQDRRIQAINKKIGAGKWLSPGAHRGRMSQVEEYAQEASDIYKSKAKTKKVYKSIQKKFHALTPDQKSEVYMKKAKRDPKSFYFDKKKFGKK